MATIYDTQQELVNLIINAWDDSDTDDLTPNIGKITDYPFELQFGNKQGYILIYSTNESEEVPGLGMPTHAKVEESMKIDIRVFNNESYFKKVKAELRRILYANRVSGTQNTDILDLDNVSITNLSNRMKKVFREVRELKVTIYNRDMTI